MKYRRGPLGKHKGDGTHEIDGTRDSESLKRRRTFLPLKRKFSLIDFSYKGGHTDSRFLNNIHHVWIISNESSI